MKPRIIFVVTIFISLLFYSCKENKITIIPNEDFEYKKFPEVVAKVKNSIPELEEMFEKIHPVEKDSTLKNSFLALYISEKGEIEKTKVILSVDSETDRKFVNALEAVHFEPATDKGQKIKSQLAMQILSLKKMNTDQRSWKVIFSPWSQYEKIPTTDPKYQVQDFSNKPLDEEPLIFVEQMPNYKGGNDALLKFLGGNIRYPELAKRAGIEGKVMVEFVIDKQGKVRNARVLRGIGAGCDEEAIRVINMMKDWEPGKQAGKPVNVKMVIPIHFKLQ